MDGRRERREKVGAAMRKGRNTKWPRPSNVKRVFMWADVQRKQPI